MVKIGNAPGWGKLPTGSSAKCQKCGKPFKDPKYKFCFECSQKMKEVGDDTTQEIALPKECIFQTFYDDKGHLKREIFIEAAEKASELFMNANISQTSIRNLFNLLKDMANRLKADRQFDFGIAQETFYKFHRQVVYNVKRQILNPVFKEFAEKHLDAATKTKEEYLGFVEYLTSIVARLKSKSI